MVKLYNNLHIFTVNNIYIVCGFARIVAFSQLDLRVELS